MAATLPAQIRKRAEEATLDLPFRVPPQEWFSLAAAGAVLGLKESTMEKLYDKGEVTGHSHNAGDGLRQHKRVLRSSLVAYAIRTADYDDQSLGDSLVHTMRFLPLGTLERIAGITAKLIESKKFSPTPSVNLRRAG